MEVIHLTPQLWQTNEISELAKDLINFQKDFEKSSLVKDAKNKHLRNEYVSLDNLLHVVRPLLSKNNLVLSQDLSGEYITTTLLHSSGQFKGSAMPFNPMQGNKGTNILQEIGGGITYAKRYSISALLSISVDIDDDGNSMPNKAMQDPRKAVPKDKVQDIIDWAKEKGYQIKNVEQVYKLTPTQKTTILKALK